MSENKGGITGKVTANAVPDVRAIQEELTAAEKVLNDMMAKRLSLGLDAVRTALLEEIQWLERIWVQIDKAFGGQLFIQELGPMDPANIRRSIAFFGYAGRCQELVVHAMEAWISTFGINVRRCPARVCPLRGEQRPRKNHRQKQASGSP